MLYFKKNFFIITKFYFFLSFLYIEVNCKCSDLNTNCFSCVSCGGSDNCNCNWDLTSNNGECKEISNRILSSFDHSLFISKCGDSNSFETMEKYCGNKKISLDSENNKITIIPKIIDGYYFDYGFYCEYNFEVEKKYRSKNAVSFGIEVRDNAFNKLNIDYEIKKYSEPYSYMNYYPKSFYISSITEDITNLEYVKFYIYIKSRFDKVPYTISIVYKPGSNFALYLVIGLIIFFCVTCGICVYCLTKKIAENARLRQRSLLENALNRDRIYSRNLQSSNQNVLSEEEIIEENLNKIGILFKDKMAPKLFEKSENYKDGNCCTICLEDFIVNKSKVSVTPCNHVFHFKCISNWLHKNAKNPKCPNCNNNLIEDIILENKTDRDENNSENIEIRNVVGQVEQNNINNVNINQIDNNFQDNRFNLNRRNNNNILTRVVIRNNLND